MEDKLSLFFKTQESMISAFMTLWIEFQNPNWYVVSDRLLVRRRKCFGSYLEIESGGEKFRDNSSLVWPSFVSSTSWEISKEPHDFSWPQMTL